jgi:hypothetical protein
MIQTIPTTKAGVVALITADEILLQSLAEAIPHLV